MKETTFHAKKAPVNRQLVLGGTAIVIVLSVFIVWGAPELGIPAVIVFCALVGMKVWRFLGYAQDDRLVVVDEEGITDRSYGLGFIPWDNIRAVRLKDVQRIGRSYKVIELVLHDEERFFADATRDRKLIRRGIASGITGVWINAWLLDASAAEVVDTIREYLDQYKRTASVV